MCSNIHESDVCGVSCIHPLAVRRAKKAALANADATDVSHIFQVMADPTRLRIISILAESELCVCDIAAALAMTVSAVSHQLRTLRMAQLVRYRKEGRIAFYSLDDEHVMRLLALGREHLNHASPPNKRKSGPR